MDFQLSDEQIAIAALAADLFGDGRVPDWPMLLEVGIPGLLVPEVLGGAGLGYCELALVLLEQGRALNLTPLWRHALAAHALATGGATPIDGDRLTVAIDGDAVATVASAGWRLDGTLRAVGGVTGAQRVVVCATCGRGTQLFVVALDSPGVGLVNGVLTDGDGAADVCLCGVTVGPEACLSDDMDREWLRDRASACVVALAAGVARGAIERTAGYVGTRRQFGRPVGSFQAVAVRMADAFTAVEVTQTLLYELCWRIDSATPLGSLAAIASYWANECGHRVAHTAMHLHGGIGADTSYPVHRVLLMSRALELTLGGAHRQIAHIGERLAV
jgi:alkylation response protein AidB-like acyl-CoA dehydrogenase